MNNGPLCPQPCSSKDNSNAATITDTRMAGFSTKLNRQDYMTENEFGDGSQIITNRRGGNHKIWLAATLLNYSPAIGLHFLNSPRNLA